MNEYNSVINEISNFKIDTSTSGVKLYKFILLLSMVDYLRDMNFDVEEYCNIKIPVVDLVDYYRCYLEIDEIQKVSYNDKTNIKALESFQNNPSSNKSYLENMLQNPVRHLSASFYSCDDTGYLTKVPGKKASRKKETFATYVKFINSNNYGNKELIEIIYATCNKIIGAYTSIEKYSSESKTRVGQSIYRQKLLEKYNCKCAICGEEFIPMLVASHAKPWVKCDTIHEKLSENNGLLLCSNHDSLFDKGYITIISDTKEILISSEVVGNIKANLPSKYSLVIDSKMVKYLNYHRDYVFKGIKNGQ